MSSGLRSTYIPSLDGLRCVAIVPVWGSHVLQMAGASSVLPGNFGVTLFFFLSGYLITTLMRVEVERTGSVGLRLFYLRRAIRIFPTCYLVLIVLGVVGLATAHSRPGWLLGQAVHLTNYQIIYGGWNAPIAPYTEVYWSLAVEEHFYLGFPLVFLLMTKALRPRTMALSLLGVCALVFAWRLWLVFGVGAEPDRTYLATDTRIDAILYGCVLAVYGNPALDPTRVSERAWKFVLLPGALLVILATFLASRSGRETWGYTVQSLCLFAVFVTAVRYPAWGPMRILNLRFVRWVGQMSFAIYLIHPAMIDLAMTMVGRSLVVLVPTALALTIAVAALLYHGIEVPLGRIRKRLSVVARA